MFFWGFQAAGRPRDEADPDGENKMGKGSKLEILCEENRIYMDLPSGTSGVWPWKSPILIGNQSSNPYLAGSMLIYWRVSWFVQSSHIHVDLKKLTWPEQTASFRAKMLETEDFFSSVPCAYDCNDSPYKTPFDTWVTQSASKKRSPCTYIYIYYIIYIHISICVYLW